MENTEFFPCDGIPHMSRRLLNGNGKALQGIQDFDVKLYPILITLFSN